ncbi:hypothetical protein GS610_05960 [Ruegeria sp. HKCCD6228]|uniref:hypothetical protein n=1 Tax=Ruegeria sp. HKCCA5463 TaxID=2682994 RepID=UPI001A0BFF43|nr:hypothetical protein [Ruegeria sp. HKCCA5463]NOD96748.1 hypothetical protein [Ruegeria sp. HKCCD6228]
MDFWWPDPIRALISVKVTENDSLSKFDQIDPMKSETLPALRRINFLTPCQWKV